MKLCIFCSSVQSTVYTDSPLKTKTVQPRYKIEGKSVELLDFWREDPQFSGDDNDDVKLLKRETGAPGGDSQAGR